ncbi:hypothetical protein ACA910_014131 [Epithemia clementina (nom. ined.)]
MSSSSMWISSLLTAIVLNEPLSCVAFSLGALKASRHYYCYNHMTVGPNPPGRSLSSSTLLDLVPVASETADRVASIDEETWASFYNDLVSLTQVNGHSTLQQVTADNPNLKQWLHDQREHFKWWKEGKATTMTRERQRRLDELDRSWRDFHNDDWFHHYLELEGFYEKHGSCQILSSKENSALGKWVRQQRGPFSAFQAGKSGYHLSPLHAAMLDRLNFEMDAKETLWIEHYDELVEYVKTHGDCLVPPGYAANPKLALWVKDQRSEYKKRQGNYGESTMTEERVQLLTNVGFDWDPHHSILMKRYLELEGYAELTMERVRLLTAGGFLDSLDPSQTAWTKRYKQLKAYSKFHGDCLVPPRYSASPELGRWVMAQRRNHKILHDHNNGDNRNATGSYNQKQYKFSTTLTEHREQLLEDIGFAWDEDKNMWMERYRELMAYANTHGDCLVPQQANDRNTASLGRWVAVQRSEYKRIKDNKACKSYDLTQERVRLLEFIGFEWDLDLSLNGTVHAVVKVNGSSSPGTVPPKWKEPPTESPAGGTAPSHLDQTPMITKTQVRALFDLWNDALATLDSTIVAQRYAADPMLLPTVSDTPRTDLAGLVDYFDTFLKLKPQGVITEGKITVGPGFAQDAGIYEFTMGATGAKVRARYSFVYVYEEGEWKIAHHHSSTMPERAQTQISKQECKGLFHLWNDALAKLDPDTVAKRYSINPVLLPTVSDVPRTDYASIKDYFVNFLKLKPRGKILKSYVTIGNNWCKDVGVYEFTMGAKVKARYSFVYVKEFDEWKISHHHSSAMPESKTSNKLSEHEVRGLFKLWNGALATLDSDKVASRYAKNSVLLPTISDVPRTDYASKKDYFDNFLKSKPQGEILESYVQSGEGWCKDVGIYEFTMGATGNKVKGRYSFVYVLEDGEWKISHHHSSVMPEGILAPSMTPEQRKVRALFDLWNDALATLDSTTVAQRYAADPMLLPTVSDTPRTDFAGIKSYFDIFLKLKPQGVITSGKITVGPDWAQDAGIYEFTMGATGAKVRARYSFIYVVENGEWKIAHHHSSTMPESAKVQITKEECQGLFHRWNDALATLDSDTVAQRYAQSAILLPTVSDVPRTDYAGIKNYFDLFLKLQPRGKILSSFVTIGNNWCKDVGIYEFTMGATGDKVKARYSFVYVKEGDDWKIAHHHSSAMPESKKMTTKLSEPEVKGLFKLWNDALATLDSDQVARRYAKQSVLLPTLSDIPRIDYQSKKDYFDTFLLNQPQGEILESHVEAGDGWCKDVGLYEFTMGATGQKVKGRYSFVYVLEDDDDEWKIAHHHSSVMPECILL